MRLLLLLFILSVPSFATNAFGAFTTNAVACFQSTPCTVTFASLPALAQIFVVGYVATGSYTGFTVSDSVNSSYTCTVPITTGARIANGCYFFNSSASGSTVTVSLTPTGGSGNVGMDLGAWYYTSTAPMQLDGLIPSNTGIASGNSFITPSITTMGGADLVVPWVWATNGQTAANLFTVDSSFTVRSTAGNSSFAGADGIGATAGTYQPTFSNTGISAGVGVTGIMALENTPTGSGVATSPSVIIVGP